MELDEFLYNLHFDIDQVRPVTVEVDWEDAPLSFKLYQGLPAVQLSLDVPLTLGEGRLHSKAGADVPPRQSEANRDAQQRQSEANRDAQRRQSEADGSVQLRQSPSLKETGDLCFYTYGLTKMCHALVPFSDADGPKDPVMQLLRRYVPSGGGLYPSELYAYLNVQGLAQGVYHYDVAHHRLVLLREGNFDTYLEKALGHRVEMAKCFATFFVSTMFWKNYYKYHDFSYRLQALDAGALTGQLVEVAKQFGYASSVRLEFLDRAVNHLLGLRDEEESVYAVIPLSTDENRVGTRGTDGEISRNTESQEFATVLCTELPVLHHRHYVKSRRVKKYPLLVRTNEASMMESTSSFTRGDQSRQSKRAQSSSEAAKRDAAVAEKTEQAVTKGNGTATTSQQFEGLIALPRVAPLDYDFAAACRGRFSPGLDFIPGQLELENLAVLLAETARAATEFGTSDERGLDAKVSVGVCVHGIGGLNDGAYIYDATTHSLRLVRAGDHRLRLQSGMSMPTVNFFQVPVCMHLIGSLDSCSAFGYRGYRIGQMEIGMILQRLLLTASALGMNGHPLLGYDEGDCDDIYGLGTAGETCLIEVPIGFYRKTSRFEGSLRA